MSTQHKIVNLNNNNTDINEQLCQLKMFIRQTPLNFIEIDLIRMFFDITNLENIFTLDIHSTETSLLTIRNKALHYNGKCNIFVDNMNISEIQLSKLIKLKQFKSIFPSADSYECFILLYTFPIYVYHNNIEAIIADYMSFNLLSEFLQWIELIQKLEVPEDMKCINPIDTYIQNVLEEAVVNTNTYQFYIMTDLYTLGDVNIFKTASAELQHVFLIAFFKLIPQQSDIPQIISICKKFHKK